MKFKSGWMCLLFVAGCGAAVTEDTSSAEPETGTVEQAAMTSQGRTWQGRTWQGRTWQGTTGSSVWAANVGGWQVRTSTGGFVAATGRLSGTKLSGVTSTGTVWPVPLPPPPLTSTVVAPISGTLGPVSGSGVTVLATFYMQEVRDSSMGPLVPARIVGSFVDQGPYGPGDARNLLEPQYRSVTSPNADIRFYQLQAKNSLGEWVSFCPTDAGSPQNAALFMPRYLRPSGKTQANAQFLGITCSDGTAAKCARWGYKWWNRLTPTGSTTSVPLAPLWEGCFRAAMADYCETGGSHTVDGTAVDLWDRYGFIKPVPETEPFGSPHGAGGPTAFSAESAFNANGTVCLQKERFADLPAECGSQQTFLLGNEFCTTNPSLPPGTWSSCGPKGLVGPARVFERGQLSSCVAEATADGDIPLIFVASWNTACTHSPLTTGTSLGIDCNWLTSQVCRSSGYQSCCHEDQAGNMYGTWSSACVQKAQQILNSPVAVGGDVIGGGVIFSP